MPPILASEIAFHGVYFPPFFFTVLIGFVCALGVTKALKVTGWNEWFWHPGLVFLAFWLLLTSVIGLTVIPP